MQNRHSTQRTVCSGHSGQEGADLRGSYTGKIKQPPALNFSVLWPSSSLGFSRPFGSYIYKDTFLLYLTMFFLDREGKKEAFTTREPSLFLLILNWSFGNRRSFTKRTAC